MNRELTVTIQERQYIVKYPNVGQLIDISVRENGLTRGGTRDLMFSGLPEHQEAYLTIKVIAFMDIMLPNVVKDLKVDSLLELDPIDFKIINDVYYNEIYKWLNEWKEALQKLGRDSEES